MRFLITATTDPNAPTKKAAAEGAEAAFDEKVFTAYMKFNEDMHNAGVLVASEGINPAKKGAQVTVKNGKRVLVDGPYAESKELVGGFYLIDVGSLEEAVEWAMRCPVGLDFSNVLTIHPMTEESDIPPELVALIRKVAPRWSETFAKRR